MHLHLDCQFGIAGDMLLAALIDAGADKEAIVGFLRDIPLNGFELDCRRTTRNGIAAMAANVTDTTSGHAHDDGAHGHDHHHGDPHDPRHDHFQDHAHTPGHDHHHDHDHDHGDERPHRHLSDLLALLEPEVVPERVRERAGRVFRILAEAEATVHGQTIERVHFHEISGIDTAVDVIGSCYALELLGVESISASAPAVGSGMVMCEHGIFPIPAPATLEILKSRNVPWRPGGDGERATPTGVALLAGLSSGFGDAPELTVTRIGYGAGRKEFADTPNLLRAIIGKRGFVSPRQRSGGDTIIAEAAREPGGEVVRVGGEEMLPEEVLSMLPGEKSRDRDRVVEFRFVVDDMTPEALGYMCERVLSSGAAEAYVTAAMMKKGRPGHEVTVLCSPDRAGVVVEVLWRESTTFGMRVGERSRLVLPREMRTVGVLGQRVRVKLGWREGVRIRCQPEYEDCKAAALATGRGLDEMYRLAREAAESE